MFERITTEISDEEEFHFLFQGKPIAARSGDTVASALLAAGVVHFRDTPVSGQLRGPFCMMGACFECLIDLDGETVQACMTPAKPDVEIRMPSIPDHAMGANDDTV